MRATPNHRLPQLSGWHDRAARDRGSHWEEAMDKGHVWYQLLEFAKRDVRYASARVRAADLANDQKAVVAALHMQTGAINRLLKFC